MKLFLPLLASVTVCIRGVGIRLFQERVQRNGRELQVFQILYTFLCGLLFLAFSGLRFPQSEKGLLLAAAFAVCLSGCTIGLTQSLLCGPMSLSGVISSCSVVMPILFGCLVYEETLSGLHLVGIGCLLATFAVTGLGTEEGRKEITPRWLFMVMLNFLGGGFGAIILAIYNKLPEPGTNNGFMVLSFFGAAVLLTVFTLLNWRGLDRKQETVHITGEFAGYIAIAALGCFGTNMLIIYLSGVMPASLLHPLYNGAGGLLMTLVSCILFRERMTAKKAVILLLGLCTVVLLNL